MRHEKIEEQRHNAYIPRWIRKSRVSVRQEREEGKIRTRLNKMRTMSMSSEVKSVKSAYSTAPIMGERRRRGKLTIKSHRGLYVHWGPIVDGRVLNSSLIVKRTHVSGALSRREHSREERALRKWKAYLKAGRRVRDPRGPAMEKPQRGEVGEKQSRGPCTQN